MKIEDGLDGRLREVGRRGEGLAGGLKYTELNGYLIQVSATTGVRYESSDG